MNKVFNLFLTALLACSIFDQGDRRMELGALRDEARRLPASIPILENEKFSEERVRLREAGRRCESGERCTQAILIADRMGLYDIGIRYAKLDCQRTGKPCFMAGHLSAKAQYSDETIFWNIIEFCTEEIDGVPCNEFKVAGYREQTFLELLGMNVGRTTVENLVFSSR